MKKLTKILALVLCFAMIAAFAACGGKTNTDDTTAPSSTENANPTDTSAEGADLSAVGEYTAGNTAYVLGASGPLTGSASSYGISVQQGAQIAVNEINENGGINGVLFDFRMIDDEATAEKASTAYDTLYEGGMQISIGSVTSGSCESFASRADEDGVFFITPSASAATVIAASDYGFRICFGDPDQGVLAADELTANYSKIGAIYDTSDTYSSGIYEAFRDRMNELNVEYIEQSFDQENNRDFSTQVDALAECDAIFLPIYYTEAGLIAKACAAKGVEAVLFGCDGLDGIADQLDDTVTAKISYITPFDATSTDEKTAAFVASYQDAYGTTPDQFAADAYDAVYVVYNAMLKTGVDNVNVAPDALGDAVVAAITDPSFSYDGVTGSMTWETSGACNKTPIIIEVK